MKFKAISLKSVAELRLLLRKIHAHLEKNPEASKNLSSLFIVDTLGRTYFVPDILKLSDEACQKAEYASLRFSNIQNLNQASDSQKSSKAPLNLLATKQALKEVQKHLLKTETHSTQTPIKFCYNQELALLLSEIHSYYQPNKKDSNSSKSNKTFSLRKNWSYKVTLPTCPITRQPLFIPVLRPQGTHNFELYAAMKHFSIKKTDPILGSHPMNLNETLLNQALLELIQLKYQEEIQWFSNFLNSASYQSEKFKNTRQTSIERLAKLQKELMAFIQFYEKLIKTDDELLALPQKIKEAETLLKQLEKNFEKEKKIFKIILRNQIVQQGLARMKQRNNPITSAVGYVIALLTLLEDHSRKVQLNVLSYFLVMMIPAIATLLCLTISIPFFSEIINAAGIAFTLNIGLSIYLLYSARHNYLHYHPDKPGIKEKLELEPQLNKEIQEKKESLQTLNEEKNSATQLNTLFPTYQETLLHFRNLNAGLSQSIPSLDSTNTAQNCPINPPQPSSSGKMNYGSYSIGQLPTFSASHSNTSWDNSQISVKNEELSSLKDEYLNDEEFLKNPYQDQSSSKASEETTPLLSMTQ